MKTIDIKHGNFIGKYSAIPSPIDKRDFVATFVPTEQIVLPSEYVTPNLTEILNQAQVGSCVAHACDSVFEYLNQLHYNKSQRFSPGFIYAHKDDKTTSGMIPRQALKFITDNGNVKQNDFPYNLEVPDVFTQYEKSGGDVKLIPLANQHKEILTYFQLKTQQDIKSNIYKYGYCTICIPIKTYTQVKYTFIGEDPVTHECQDYEAYFDEGDGDVIGYHEVCLVGWSDSRKCYVLQNSWGKDWGKDGKAYYSYDADIIEAWGCSGYTEVNHNTPVPDPIIHKPSQNEFVQWFMKILNWIINFFKR